MSTNRANASDGLVSPPSPAEIDGSLCAQLIVAWAGESGAPDDPSTKRLAWWRTDLTGEGVEYDLRELLPNTWRWAAFQAVREAARRHDSMVRSKDHDPDRLLTLFSLGFEIDEKLDERLLQLKQTTEHPAKALPDLAPLIDNDWSEDGFVDWVKQKGKETFTSVPAGRRLKGKPPERLSDVTERLIAGLAPIAENYPMPHFRKDA